MINGKTKGDCPKALKQKYLECFEVHTPSAIPWRRTVVELVDQGFTREDLINWAVYAGHSRRTVSSLLSRIFCSLGIRERDVGAGRKPTHQALELAAHAHARYGGRFLKVLRAAWRAGKTRIEAQDFNSEAWVEAVKNPKPIIRPGRIENKLAHTISGRKPIRTPNHPCFASARTISQNEQLRKDAMNDQLTEPISGPFTLAGVRTAKPAFFRHPRIFLVLLLCFADAFHYPAAGQDTSTVPSSGTAQTNPTISSSTALTNQAYANWLLTNQAPANPVSVPTAIDAATAMGISPRPDGQFQIVGDKAVASYATHTLALAGNLRTEGSVDLVMSDGLELKGGPIGLFYFNTAGESVMIATLTDTAGQIIQSGSTSMALFTNCFEGAARADILYSYTQLSVQQDIIFRSQIPSPQDAGISGEVSLGFLTLFQTTAVPTVIPDTVALSDYNLTNADLGDTLADQKILFPTMNIARGRGFLLGDSGVEIPIVKTWQSASGPVGTNHSYYLIESVPLALIQDQLVKLPPATAQNGGPSSGSGSASLVSARLQPSFPIYNLQLAIDARGLDWMDADPRFAPAFWARMEGMRWEKLGGSLAPPARPSLAILHPPSSILALPTSGSPRAARFVFSGPSRKNLPQEPGFVWDYTIVSQPVMNFVFGPRGTNKVGFAAAGETTNDVWNICTNNCAFTNLLWSTSSGSGAGITVSNATGSWGNPVSDNMYMGYVYQNSGYIYITITNLASGSYDFYIYAHGADDQQNGAPHLVSNGTDYGTNYTASVGSNSWTSTYWELGQQYVVFTNVTVSSSQPVSLTMQYGVWPFSVINGMQIVPTTSSCLNAPNGLVSWWQGEGNGNDAVGVNNATAHSMSYVSGKVGQAFSFNGTSGYLSLPASASLNLGTNGTGLTIEGWINPSDLSNWRPVMEWNNGTNASVYLWLNPNAHTLELNIVDTNGWNHDFLGSD